MSIYKGGYITIDCGGGDVSSLDGITIPGVYEAVKETEGKLVILSNLQVSGQDLIYAAVSNLVKASDEYNGVVVGQYLVTITNADLVYAVSLE